MHRWYFLVVIVYKVLLCTVENIMLVVFILIESKDFNYMFIFCDIFKETIGTYRYNNKITIIM